jgi:outer membrane protein OmpA-like peptidoglycan-associated protein
MHRERIRLCVVASALALAGCGGGLATDRTFPVFFDNSSVTLDQPAQDIVVRASDVAKQFPRAAVTVQGHADGATIGTGGAQLSADRADAVTASLVAHGVDASRVKRSDGGLLPDQEADVASRRVDIAIAEPIGKL